MMGSSRMLMWDVYVYMEEVQTMRVRGHKTQKTFMYYIKLFSDGIADEIDAIVAASNGDIF